MTEQLPLVFRAPRRKRTADPFVSNQETGVYFWQHGDETRDYQFSNRPHALLPHYCAEHEWWSDVPCRAEHPCPTTARKRRDEAEKKARAA